MNYIIDIFDPHLRTVFALIDLEKPDHIQTQFKTPSLVAVFDANGREDGVAPRSCLIMAPVDVEAALKVIRASPNLGDWAADALLLAVDNDPALNLNLDNAPLTAFEWKRSFLTEPAYNILRKREDGKEAWRKSFGKQPVEWDALPPELSPMLDNDHRSQMELYQWEFQPPEVGERYYCYTALDMSKNYDRFHYRGRLLTTWMGEPIIRLTDFGRLFHMYGKRSYDSPQGYMWVTGVDLHGHTWRGIIPHADGLACGLRRTK